MKEKKGMWSIIGLAALVVVLFIGVKIAFAGLDLAIGQNQPEVVRHPLSTESGGDSQWMLLNKSEDNDEVKQWLEKADQTDRAYWLERQEAGGTFLAEITARDTSIMAALKSRRRSSAFL